MPSLENLKKQAKLVLRWHRDRYYPVAAQIRAVLPRFRHLSDPEVLNAGFKLSDAQEMVARQHGFDSWQALKAGVSSMPEQTAETASRAVLTSAFPQLFVADIKAACDFYTEKLGFKITILYGNPPFYAHVARDGATLILRCVDQPVMDAALREREELLSAECCVNTAEEIKALFLEFQAAGVTFFQTLKRMPWEARNFIIKDPDGNLVLFAGPAE